MLGKDNDCCHIPILGQPGGGNCHHVPEPAGDSVCIMGA